MNKRQRTKSQTDTVRTRAMEEVTGHRDRARAEAAARQSQPKPASSGQLNPGGEEYHQTLPKGPGGTGGAIDAGIPEPPGAGSRR